MTVDNFKGKSLAVVIGIDDYRNGVPSLKTPVNDAQTLATILQERHEYDVKLLLNEAASGTALRALLETELPQRLSKDHRLLFYFAGHGIALNGDDGPEGYLIPSGAKLGDVGTYLPMTLVNQALLKLPCRHFLGILDCCFAGAFRWSSTRKLVPMEQGTLHKERFDRFIRDPAWQVITSAASDQFAQDAFDLKSTQRGLQGNHSPFAAALIEALEGQADAYPPAEPGKPAGDGVITATELYLYLRDQVEPEAETRSMRQTPGIFPLTRHDKGEFIFLSPGHPLNLPPAPPLDESSNPYRGLESFDEAHKDLFFGRQALTHTLAEFVTKHPLTVVLGASGSGKSSLVKAGLIPKLQQADGWAFLSPFRPGESPFKALNQVLQVANLPEIAPAAEATSSGLLTPAQGLSLWFQAHPHTHLLVVVDQFEELITLCRDQQERKEFLDVLAEAIAAHPTQLHLVLTLRSDFEPSLRSDFEQQSRKSTLEISWQDARFVVPAMTRDELRQAIEAPASARVMVFDPHELVDQLIDEVANMPGALPLLSFALSELYLNYLKRQKDARDKGETLDRAMTQADYAAMGGVTRSLTQRAERVYEERVAVDPAYEHTIRNVMLRMVSIGGELARRRVPEVELVYPDAAENGRVKEAIKRFEEARLLTSDKDPDDEDKTYKEPAHDALVRGWPRLLVWKQEHLRELLLQRDLTSDANQWETSGKKKQDSGLLWIEDPRLPTALQLSCGKGYKDNWLNLFRWRFSYQTWQSQTPEHWLNTSETDFVGQSFDQKFKRFRNTTIIVAGVILTLSGLTGYAFVQQGLATQSAQEANRQKDEAKKQEGIAKEQAGIALTNQNRAEDNQKEAKKQEGIAKVQAGIALTNQKKAEDNQKEATKQAGIAKVQAGIALSNQKKAEQRRIEADRRRVNAEITAQSLESESLLASHLEIEALVESIKMGERLEEQDKIIDTSTKVRAIVSLQKVVYGVRELNRLGDILTANTAIFSPDGKIVATVNDKEDVKIWSSSGKFLAALPKDKCRITHISFNPKGNIFLTANDCGIVEFWNLTGTQTKTPLKAHNGAISSFSFNSNGQTIATAGEDDTVKLWNTNEVPQEKEIVFRGKKISSVSFSPDDTNLVIVSDDNKISILDLTSRKIKAFAGNGNQITFAPNNQFAVISRLVATLWNLDGQRRVTFDHDGAQVRSFRFSPNGKYVVTGGDDGKIKVWNLEGKLLRIFRGHGTFITSVDFNHDSNKIMSADDSGLVQIWSLEEPKNTISAQNTNWLKSLNSRFPLCGIPIQEIRNPKLQQVVEKINKAHKGTCTNAISFSPDGTAIASGGNDGTVRLWTIMGKEIRVFTGHPSFVNSVSFSPDGKVVASAGGLGAVKLWDLNGQEIANLSLGTLWNPAEQDSIAFQSSYEFTFFTDVWFSPDGKVIAAGDINKELMLWNLDLDGLLFQGCTRLKDYLTNNLSGRQIAKDVCVNRR